MVFAHNLGVLVLDQALVELSTSNNRGWNAIANLLKGATFFDIPNFGMEQTYLMTIVKDNPNAALVGALVHDFDILNRLEEAFKKSVCNSTFQCYCAYEKATSPPVVENTNYQRTTRYML
jgi:hypothetical protein